MSVDGRDNGKAYVIEFDFEKGSFKARDITMGRSRHIIDSGDFHTVSSRYELAILIVKDDSLNASTSLRNSGCLTMNLVCRHARAWRVCGS